MADNKNNELLEQLEKGIRDTMNSENYKRFLKFQSTFHSYSFNNTMLIFLQRPNATMVAGYKAWQKLDRQVMKGEKGIRILAPCPYKYEKTVEKVDPNTGKKVSEKEEIKGLRFRSISVFDVKQTDGKELPSICNELQGNSVNAENIIKAVKNISEVPIIDKLIESGAKGYYSPYDNIIAINKGMSLDQTAKTIIHEYTHSQLHNSKAATGFNRAEEEIQAESVAYIVSNRFGLDTSEYSFEYLANWSNGKELKELNKSFDLIQKTADNIINKIEDVLKKELEYQNEPVKIKILWSESDQLNDGEIFNFKDANNLLEKLDKEQIKLRKVNEQYDYSKATAGEQLPYVPYLKTKFEILLSDGRVRQGRFDLGESGYKNFTECIQKQCCIDVERYIKEHETPEPKAVIDIKDKIINIYADEDPSIKYISNNTANIINNINMQHGKDLSLKEIKQMYKELGNKLENSNNKDDLQNFNTLKEVIDDMKQAQLKELHNNAKIKVEQVQLSKSNLELE